MHGGVAPYRPNSLDGGCPFLAGADDRSVHRCSGAVAGGEESAGGSGVVRRPLQSGPAVLAQLSPVEREHIIGAYTFELNKCYEQAIKERALKVLAHVDPQLCRRVADGLGLPEPKPIQPLATPDPSPALSQLGRVWPLDGRVVGIVADENGELNSVRTVRRSILDAGMVPLVIAPAGGQLGSGGDSITVQRTFATARSVEYDAILLAGVPGIGRDAYGSRDAKAGAGATQPDTATDPRILLMVSEAFRHGKAIGGWAGAEAVLEAAGLPRDAPGLVIGSGGDSTLEQITQLLGTHRVWQRFPAAV